MTIRKAFFVTALILLGPAVSYGQSNSQRQAVINTLDAFHQAIIDNDSQRARTLLSDSVRILEGGDIETKNEYLSHHFHSDGKFLSAMNREVESQNGYG